MTEKTKDTSATADDEVEIIDEDEDETEVVDDAPASDKAKTKADPADTDGDDEDGDDDEPSDRAEIERKRKIKAQKQARAEKRRADALEERLAQLEQTVGSVDLERNREAAAQRLKAAEQAHDEAYEDGDPAKIRAALKELRTAETEAAEYEKAPKQQPRQPTRQPAASVNPHRDSFIEKYESWFDPNGGDRDSAVVRALSAALLKEGVDPATKEHFSRLEKDMKQYLPHRFKAPARQTSASSSSGRRSDDDERPGKVVIHGMTIKAFKDNFGLDWNDPDPEKRKAARDTITKRQREVQAARGAA